MQKQHLLYGLSALWLVLTLATLVIGLTLVALATVVLLAVTVTAAVSSGEPRSPSQPSLRQRADGV
jgi:uncharacterized membrane protein